MIMSRLKHILFHLFIMFIFVGFVIAIRFKPITQTFQFDYDEAFNLMKAFLYSQGFSLYTQIWNDQPPLFTVILSHWLNLFSQSIFAARFLVLLFSALLVWCFYQIIYRELGRIPALLATILLFTSWLYIRMSISVMIGIPALSLAMLSIYLLKLYKHNYQQLYLVLSGICLALSLQTKMFTIFLVPLMMLELIDFRKNINLNKIKNLFIWLILLGIIYIFISFLYQQFGSQDQLIKSHLNQPLDTKIENFNNLEYLRYMISQDYDYIFLAFIGIGAILFRKQKNGLFPLTWLGTAILILLKHRPIWYHYYPLLAIPICWLAAYAIALLRDSFSKNWHGNFNSMNIKKLIFPCLAIVTFIGLIIVTPPNPIGSVPKNTELMQLVLKYKTSTHWMFTDNSIYAFYAGLRVPPEIAVMSYKRLNSGELTFKELLAVFQNYRPEQIVLCRWTSLIKSDRNLISYINDNYSKTYTNAQGTEEHYILK